MLSGRLKPMGKVFHGTGFDFDRFYFRRAIFGDIVRLTGRYGNRRFLCDGLDPTHTIAETYMRLVVPTRTHVNKQLLDIPMKQRPKICVQIQRHMSFFVSVVSLDAEAATTCEDWVAITSQRS